jgi:crotonobetainyl-CoA:carnitine CoA-transferase CaiB-like acyl-CoA transferase
MAQQFPAAPVEGQPLEGIRVIDMTTLGMGPLAGQTLGDYGAEVIKLETMSGDFFRHNVPKRSPTMAHTYLQFNRNKKSIAVDLKSEGGKQLVRELVATADILLSNTRSQSMRRLGLDYETLKEANPNLIYCACYGYSDLGDYAGRPAADDTIQAMSGLIDLQMRAGNPPNMVACVVADKAVGLMMVNALMAALIRRMKHGGGQFIEVPMFESMVAFVMPEHMAGKTFEPPMGQAGYARVINPHRRPYQTKDGLLCVLPYTTEQWLRFFRLIGRDDLVDDPDYSRPEGRSRRFEELYALIREVMPTRTTAEWVKLLLEADILIGEVKSVDELFDDPHLKQRDMFTEHEHPTEGSIRLIGFPIVSDAPATSLRLLPPNLGEHSAEIARALGRSEEDINAMIERGELLVP